jgi:hypothetical protein
MLHKSQLPAPKREKLGPKENIEDAADHSLGQPNETSSRQPRHGAQSEHTVSDDIEDTANRLAKRFQEDFGHVIFMRECQERVASLHSKNDWGLQSVRDCIVNVRTEHIADSQDHNGAFGMGFGIFGDQMFDGGLVSGVGETTPGSGWDCPRANHKPRCCSQSPAFSPQLRDTPSRDFGCR